jgi:hypothetical protein
MKHGVDRGRGRGRFLRINAAEFFLEANNNDSKKHGLLLKYKYSLMLVVYLRREF